MMPVLNHQAKTVVTIGAARVATSISAPAYHEN